MKILIESVQNKLVKKIKSLQQRKNREKEGLFVVEHTLYSCFPYISENE